MMRTVNKNEVKIIMIAAAAAAIMTTINIVKKFTRNNQELRTTKTKKMKADIKRRKIMERNGEKIKSRKILFQ